jgi:hypothetical protein
MGEITWREGNGEPTSTRTFLVVVENDVNRGTEGAPSDANPGNITLTGTIAASNLSGTNTGDQDLSGLAPIAHTHVVADIVSVASQRLIGRHTVGNGASQEVGVGNGLEFQGSGIRRSALTGDVTASAGSNDTTIANDAVTNAKLANMGEGRLKGRAVGMGTGDPEDLTAAQTKTLLAITAADITDSTAAGRTLLTAANAAAQIAALGAETPAGAAAQIAAAELTSAQIMSKAGERLIASLATVRGASNAGTCYFATTRSTSGTFTVKTSTGYARLVNSDNTLGAQAGTGDAANPITLTIPASGLHRALGIISVPFDGASQSGNITEIRLENNQLTTFSGTGLSSLTTLYLYGNQLTTFSGTGLSSLTTLYLYDNQLTTFSGTGMGALTTLWLYNNQLTTFSGTGLSALTVLDLANNQLTSYTNHPPLIGSVGGLIILNLSGNALNASQIDAAFNALYQPPRWSGTMLSVIVTIYGTNAAPTAASLTARDAYTTARWILLTN